MSRNGCTGPGRNTGCCGTHRRCCLPREEERVLARQSFWLYRCNEVVVSYGTAKPKGDPEVELQEFFSRYPGSARQEAGAVHGPDSSQEGLRPADRSLRQSSGSTAGLASGNRRPRPGGMAGKLNHRAAQLGLASRITWTGMIGGSMKWGALRAAEVFVLPSHQENFGIAVAEALAAGAAAADFQQSKYLARN